MELVEKTISLITAILGLVASILSLKVIKDSQKKRGLTSPYPSG